MAIAKSVSVGGNMATKSNSGFFSAGNFGSVTIRQRLGIATDHQHLLLWCGMLASVLYVVINIFVPAIAEGYSMKSQTVSELSAIGAPTRPVWIALIIPYSFLMIAFGFGVRRVSGENRLLKFVGALLIVNSIIGLFWPPMHLRGVEPTLTDTLHIAFTFVTVMIFMIEIALASTAIRGPFAVYSVISLLLMVTFGVLTGLQGPAIPADLPTPMIGVWERISIASYVLWVFVFAVILLRRRDRNDRY